MPIQTNLALETAFFHVPLPATADDVERLNACWRLQPPTNDRIGARLGPQGLLLTIEAPVVLVAVNDDYWKELGAIIARTGEPWWDFCAVVVDSEPQARHPHAHALSVYRVFANGRCAYLHHEEVE
jgi:hypothetical protein